MPTTPKPMWTCPRCGRQFARRNTQHSCGRFALDDHFAGKGPAVRAIFDRYLAAVQEFGPVAVYPQKTRIIFQARHHFAGAVIRRRWVEGMFWIKRRAAHPLIHRFEMHVYRDYGHYFRLSRPEDLDAELIELLHEAYVLAS